MTTDATGERLRESHLVLRRVLGVLAVALPVVLAVWGFAICECMEIQDSISDYYHLRTRDAFVGILFVIAWFLFTDRGYDTRDNVAGYLACVFALGVAFFPNGGDDLEATLHFISAVALFGILAYFALRRFTRSDKPPEERTPEKRLRNKVYVACGLAILVCLALTGGYHLLPDDNALSDVNPVFWLESLMIWAFGISWFVKGQTLWQDKRATVASG